MKAYISTVLIALVCVIGIQVDCYSYPNLETLRNDAIYLCCERGTAEILTQSAKERYSSFYRKTNFWSGIYNECCDESCSHEEVQEGYSFKSEELGEECVDEGCSFEEMFEHCPKWIYNYSN